MNIAPKSDLILDNVSDTDSYKFSHYLLYPDDMTSMFSYMESRGGEFSTATLFGLQIVLHKYLSKPINQANVDSMAAFAQAHGEPFNRPGFDRIAASGGKLPVRIRALPEGLAVPVSTPMLTIESTDSACPWIVNWLETQLCRVWYPSTVCTTSGANKAIWKKYLDLSSDNPEQEIGFKHHDFGARGVTSREQAELGGAAHLVHFFGSDTIAGIMAANHYYDCPMAGFSIPATEHSTMTIFGKGGEKAALLKWIQKTLVERTVPEGLPKLTACVGDSYDIFNFARMICSKEVRTLLESSGGTLVLRPDSGHPQQVWPELFGILESNLPYGSVKPNGKEFKVMPPYLRSIWGDGINRRTQPEILEHVVAQQGWSATNLAMGSGGGLLMDVNRDTQRFAFKCSEVVVDGVSIDVRKDPITDHGKRSKAGRLDLILGKNGYETIKLNPGQIAHPQSVMCTVFENGEIKKSYTFDEVRANADRALA